MGCRNTDVFCGSLFAPFILKSWMAREVGTVIALPEKFESRMKELLKDEFQDFLKGFEEERYGGVRFNSLKTSKEEWEKIAPFEI